MPTFPGPWQPPPPRQQIVDTGAANSAATRVYSLSTQHAVADPVTFGGAWADLLDPPVVYPLSTDNHATIEHLYDATGYLGQPIDTWQVDQLIFDLTPRLRYPLVPLWTPPLPWPAHAVDWEYDFSGNTTGVNPLASEDLTMTLTVHLADVLSDYTPYTPITGMSVSPVDPATLVLDYGLTGQEARPQNVQHTQLATWPEIGSGDAAVGGTVAITTDPINVADWIWSQDLAGGAVAAVRFAIVFGNFRSGVEPAANTMRQMQFVSADMVSDWQPPRWRFLFDRTARLRQYPRDDELGGVPRQGGLSQSVQASPRQGWTGTYR